MANRPIPRRQYLLTVGAVGVSGLAGCAGQDDADDDGAGTGTATTTPESTGDRTVETGAVSESFPSLSAGDPTFRDWVPGTGEQRSVIDAAHDVERVRDERAALPANAYESLTWPATVGGYIGIEYEEIDALLVSLTAGIVYLGSFTKSTVESRLGGTAYEQFDQRQDVTYYRGRPAHSGSTQPSVVGVGAEGVVYGGADRNAETPGEEFIEQTLPLFEAVRGERPRLHEESDVYARYTDDVGWPLTASAAVPRPLETRNPVEAPPGAGSLSETERAAVSAGFGQHLADDAVVDRWWLRVAPDADVTPEDVAAAVSGEAATDELNDGESLAVRRDGQVVDVAVSTPVTDPGGGTDPPLAAVRVTVEDRTATLTHAGGDTLELAQVTVRAAGETLDVGTGPFTAGDTVQVTVDGADRVVVVYESPTGPSTASLGRT